MAADGTGMVFVKASSCASLENGRTGRGLGCDILERGGRHIFIMLCLYCSSAPRRGRSSASLHRCYLFVVGVVVGLLRFLCFPSARKEKKEKGNCVA